MITTTEEYRSGLEPTSVLGAELLQVVPLWKGSSMYLKGNLITTIGPDPDYQYAVFLGGLGQNYINQTLPFLGYRFMELVGRSAVTFGATSITNSAPSTIWWLGPILGPLKPPSRSCGIPRPYLMVMACPMPTKVRLGPCNSPSWGRPIMRISIPISAWAIGFESSWLDA